MDFSSTRDPRFITWAKSTRSGNTDCLYVSGAADGSGDVAAADSKAGPGGPIQVFSRAQWTAFVAATKAGAFDRI